MKKLGIALMCLIVSPTMFAQDFQKDENYITIGYGLDPFGHSLKTAAGFNEKNTTIGPFIVTYERGITDILGIGRIGIGGAIAQSFYSNRAYISKNNVYEYKSTRSRTTFAFRVAYHFELGVEKMDVYAGIGGVLHLNSDTQTYEYPLPVYKSKSFGAGGGPSVFGGIRYYFSNNFGVYAEAGYDISALNGGVIFKF